jgi:hypothetical protein
VDVAVDRPNPDLDLERQIPSKHSAASKDEVATNLSPTSLSPCASHPGPHRRRQSHDSSSPIDPPPRDQDLRGAYRDNVFDEFMKSAYH